MTDLRSFVIANTERGECKCGKCFDAGDKPDPQGHTVDMVFFKVAKKNGATPEDFKKLTADHAGEFTQLNPFDGKEHSYIELGAWLGDQGLAMQYMGLGVLLGQFTLLSPAMLGFSGAEAQQLAGMGLLAIQAKTPEQSAWPRLPPSPHSPAPRLQSS